MSATNKLIKIGELKEPHWHQIARVFYSPEGIAPTIHCCGGGNIKPKVIIKVQRKEET